jgi:hypothetical protein
MTAPVKTDLPILRSDAGSAALEDDCIILRDRRGRRVLSFGPEGITLLAEEGDLVLAAPRGRVVIDADGGVEVSTRGRIAASAEVAELSTTRVGLRAAELVTRCADVVHHVGRLEVQAQRIFERARDAYREVDGLVQLRAGRLRQLVDGASQLVSKRAAIVCEEDVSIDGQRVLLG